jgi:hypothetical protein
MGNICSPGEDAGVESRGKMAVGSSSTNEIDDEALDLALGENAMALKSKVSLRFKCTDLPNLDKRSRTDPFCILWQVNSKG